ncbi:receptor-type tyrosine-protein phosphatase delta-like [Neodiprion fabricii]|uniref:receptor-type tyrosine-protein phosphatase delta-like n=1 Tax=Neodiprion fabricii TaxID=2872261 RepID=UPI001ED978B0|nr:receptor-type tyrosine-protein phosphatase delta-like [Neodiprion fabricii]
MVIFLQSFTAIIIILASATAIKQDDDLFAMRNSVNWNDSTTSKFICISKDNDAALVWNYNYKMKNSEGGRILSTDFNPRKPIRKDVANCAAWNSTQCAAEWEKKGDWNVVDSIVEPMGPVYDYRWEDFNELAFDDVGKSQEYRYVAAFNESTDMVVFSVRGSGNVDLRLCGNENPIGNSCLQIIVGGSDMKESAILSCVDVAMELRLQSRPKTCTTLANVEHELAIVDEYEWRTFRVKWNRDDRKTIKVFKETEIEPFMEGNLDQRYTVYHLSVKSDLGTLIRFHFYEYLSTREKNAIISTTEFDKYDKNICIKLVVGLCSECQLKVTVVDSNGDELPVGIIHGSENFLNDATLFWKPMKLTTKLPLNISQRLKIQLKTITEKYQSKGHWAMDNLRMCESADVARESTVTMHGEIGSPFLPKIKCQKLSYTRSETLDLSSTIRDRDDKKSVKPTVANSTAVLPNTTLETNLESMSPILIMKKMKKTSRSMGYFELKSKRSSFPPEGLEAVSEYQTSVTLRKKSSSSTNGNKRQRRSDTGEPTKIENLRATGISETNVTLQWDPPSSTNKSIQYKVTVKVDKFLGCSDRNESSPSKEDMRMVPKPEAIFARLHPYTNYTTTVIACIGELKEIKGELNFTTDQRDIPTETVQNLRYEGGDEVLKWDAPDCANMTGPWAETRLSFSEEAQEITSERVPSNKFQIESTNVADLGSYKTYKVRAYIVRSTEASSDGAAQSTEISFTTPASRPGKVDEMGSFDVNVEQRTVSLWWNLPFPLNGEVESYHIKIYQQKDHVTLLNEIYETPVQVSKCRLSEKSVCLENVELRTNFSVQLDAQIRAKNKDVSSLGLVATHKVLESDWRTAELTRPEHLDQIIGDDGIVTVMWKHPPLPKFKITRFEVKAELLESTLLNTNSKSQNTTTANYPVKQEQKTYNTSLRLRTSSRYQIVVTATNEKNPSSGIVDSYNITIPFKPGFASGEIPRAECKGSDIEVVIPAILNATQSTTVFINAVRVIKKGNIQTDIENVSLNYTVNRSEPRHFSLNFSQKYNITESSAETEEFRIDVCATDTDTGDNTTLETIEQFTCDSANPTTTGENPPSAFAAVVILLIVVAILLVSFLVWYRKFRQPTKGKTCLDNEPLRPRSTVRDNFKSSWSSDDSTRPASLSEIRISMQQKVPDPATHNPHSCPVKVEEFEKYAKEALSIGLLDKQYTEFEKGLQKSCGCGSLPENMTKNRYKNQIAYDETRIVLKKLDADPYSDYINANYIQGYQNPRAYIATQGPLKATVRDFWRMVWQENVSVICMLANTVERGKKKCEEYWPNVEGTNKKCGDILIRNTDADVFADYTFRTLLLTCRGEKRTVTHLHYTGWPDHGVPMYTQSLVAYLNKLLGTNRDKGPVVVHCSAGVGRTGTIILCDICLQQAAVEKKIDAPAVVMRMREGRANMVDSAQQYMLAHLAILECMIAAQTQVPCSYDLPDRVKELRKQLTSDLGRLNDTVWQDRVLHALASPPPDSPWVSGENEASQGIGNENDFINPVIVDGVKMKSQYLASRLPSPSTVSYYWQLVAMNNLELIVTLQCPARGSSTYCDIVSDEFVFFPTTDIKVEKKSNTESEHFTIDKLILTDTSSKEEAKILPVTVLTCKGWKCDRMRKPPVVTALVSLWRESEKIRRNVAPSLVLCQDGVTACGLYLALSFLLERMAVERECDVISAVRAVRRSRPKFVQSLEQFNYLYDAAINYHESFATYANFS